MSAMENMEAWVLDEYGMAETVIVRSFTGGTRDDAGIFSDAIAADTSVRANVQCAGTAKVIAYDLDRARKAIELFTPIELRIVDEVTQRRADRVYYQGEWYEIKDTTWFNDDSGANLSHGEAVAQKIIDANEKYLEAPSGA